MTLTDPREALADESSFIGYLVGLAGLGQVVRDLAADNGPPPHPSRETDEFVYLLLGLASLGDSVERLAGCVPVEHSSAVESSTYSTPRRWLR
jgi:hypothetical protein